MLRKLNEQEFDQYVGFAYDLALDMTKSGYPTYADGIKTKEDFIDRARKALTRENEEILLFVRDGAVCGWIHYYHLPEDHYLDTTAFCVSKGMEEALAEFIAFTRERFPGSALYLGFPKENVEAVAALDARGLERIEESYNDVLDFDAYIPQLESGDVVPITRENYPLFSDIHAQHADIYWNSERIWEAIDTWKIFVSLQEGNVAGAIYFRVWDDDPISEIFGVDFPCGVYDSEVFRSLLTAALNDRKSAGAKHMIIFNDDESQADALACGFRCVGQYVCFKMSL